MSETKQPDWDKITEGKIRHGFAVAAFTSGMEMTDDLCQSIERWIRYVVDGVEMKGNGTPPIEETVKDTGDGTVTGVIKEKVKVLGEEDRKNVLQALNDGNITKENLHECLRRVDELAGANGGV